jgi:signal transduction histidine kinase/ActR/RegA family two-component response regulator
LHDGLYVTIEDITKRKDSELLLRKTADRLQSTFDGVPALIVLMDAVHDGNGEPVDFAISSANKAMADFTKDTPADIIGKKMSELYSDAFKGELRESHLSVFKTGVPFQTEFLYPGTQKWFSLFVTKQVDGNGLVAVALDITEQKRSEERRKENQVLTELDQAKTEFFNNVSHEFRTPLTLMLGPIQDMIRKFKSDPLHAPELMKLQMVHRNALRLEKLVNTLLNFAQIEAGRADALFKPIDLAEYTTLLAGNFRSTIEHAGIKFKVDCESTEPIYINQDMWEKIVLNLLSNAFKFTFQGKIEVKLKSYKKHVRLYVADSGEGINPSNYSKIFERFTRIPNTKARSNEGSGIGLALVRELVKIHGGKIEVVSQEGAGSTFTVSIPKGKDHLRPQNVYEMKDKIALSPLASVYNYEAMSWGSAGTGYIADADPAAGAKPVILLVDDNSDIREYIKSILTPQHIIVTAHDGKQALELIAAGLRPDLMLADLMMPEVDGLELLKQIRDNPALSGMPFILLSARASEADRLKGLDAGADDYLVKPFSSAALQAVINSRLRSNLRTSIG